MILSSLQHRWAGPEQRQLQRMRQDIVGDSVVVGVSIAARTEKRLLSRRVALHGISKK